jgi:hypothetical protein
MKMHSRIPQLMFSLSEKYGCKDDEPSVSTYTIALSSWISSGTATVVDVLLQQPLALSEDRSHDLQVSRYEREVLTAASLISS